MPTTFIAGLAVEDEGQGQAVVCIHGLGGSSNTWTPVMAAFAGHRVVRIDLPGSGRSTTPDSLSIDAMVSAVESVIDALQIECFDIVGHSLGTIVCQHLALRQPQHVQRMALFGPLACPPEAARPNIRARAEKARSEGTAGLQAIADQIVQGATAAATKAGQLAVLALVRESVMRQDPIGYGLSCGALAEAQAAAVEGFSGQALLVTGDEDAVAPVAAVRALAARMPQAQVIVLPDCGHWTTFERPIDCSEQLSAFLAR